MKEVIDKILEEEKKAQALVEQARQDARQMKIDSEKEADLLISETRSKAAAKSKEIIQSARKEAEKRRDAALEAVKTDNEALLKNPGLDDAVNTIFQRLLGRE
jgi:vacuolar-type H+-ATPase subunit H